MAPPIAPAKPPTAAPVQNPRLVAGLRPLWTSIRRTDAKGTICDGVLSGGASTRCARSTPTTRPSMRSGRYEPLTGVIRILEPRRLSGSPSCASAQTPATALERQRVRRKTMHLGPGIDMVTLLIGLGGPPGSSR